MLGNFSSSIFTGLDRWFVKILLLSFDFAMYSFCCEYGKYNKCIRFANNCINV